MRLNPYTPGAGVMPGYLSGREKVIKEAENNIFHLIHGYPQRPVIYYGLRGVGKTVLLNKIEEYAFLSDILYCHIEVKEKTDLILELINESNIFLKELSNIEKIKSMLNKLKEAIENLSVTYTDGDNSLTINTNKDFKNVVLSNNITKLFITLGMVAKESSKAIIFFIDEIQYAKKEELEALITALHRINQLRLPITIFGAGLNKILSMLTVSKTYAERMFSFSEITSLSYEETKEAILKPIENLNITFEEKALEEIYRLTEGYPYFVQELCKILLDNIKSKEKITLNDIKNNIDIFYEALDIGFFKTRISKCTDRELEFLFSMNQCGELPCTISNVAKIMKKKVSSISPIRANLINKGIIHSNKFGEIDFSVPLFDKFLDRLKNGTVAI